MLSSGGGIPSTCLKSAKPTSTLCVLEKKKPTLQQQKENKIETNLLPDRNKHIMKTAGRFLWQWALSLVVLTGSSWTSQIWYHRDTDLHILNMLFSASKLCPPKPWVQESWIHRRKERVNIRQQKKLQQTIRIYFFLPVNLRKMWYYFDTKKLCPQRKPTQCYTGLAMSNSSTQSSSRASTCNSMNLLHQSEDASRECNHSALQ